MFSGIWSLENYTNVPDLKAACDGNVQGLDSTQIALVDAISNPSKYVVKPQKEGGGNNFYDDEAA